MLLTSERLLLIFVSKFCEIPFLQDLASNSEKSDETSVTFLEDDDLELCLYYLRTLANVLRCSGDISWGVLASKHIAFHGTQAQISSKQSLSIIVVKLSDIR